MYPELFRIGDFAITSFGLMMFLAFVTAAWITGAQLRRYGMPRELAWDMLAWVAVGGIVGAKLYYLVLNFDLLLANPVDQILSRGGLVWYGGLIGGVIAYYLQIRNRKLPVATMYDATAPALALSYAVGRMGCFLVGDDYGRYTDGPLGITFPDGGIPPATAGYMRSLGQEVPATIPDSAIVPVHPTQLYEIGLALIMFAILWHLGRKRLRVGQLFAVYLVLYAIERFLIEFVRAKSDIVALGGVGISTSQIVSVILFLLGIVLWFRQGRGGAVAPVSGGGTAGAGRQNRVPAAHSNT
jgi:phosphatidylglycerol---prolipoprotein diacylglyceryl transferase